MMFDIHLASDVLSCDLNKELLEVGFKNDNFIGGVRGIAKKYHLSKHLSTRTLFIQSWHQTIDLLSATSRRDFYGYAEAEVIPPQRVHRLDWKAYDPSVPFPFGALDQSLCPVGRHKDFDFHLTVNLQSVDPRLRRLLEDEVNFYYVDISKPSGGTVRVYTFQPMGLKESPVPYFRLLVEYLHRAGGFEGKVQLETTYAYQRFPETAPVPPVVTKLPPLK